MKADKKHAGFSLSLLIWLYAGQKEERKTD